MSDELRSARDAEEIRAMPFGVLAGSLVLPDGTRHDFRIEGVRQAMIIALEEDKLTGLPDVGSISQLHPMPSDFRDSKPLQAVMVCAAYYVAGLEAKRILQGRDPELAKVLAGYLKVAVDLSGPARRS